MVQQNEQMIEAASAGGGDNNTGENGFVYIAAVGAPPSQKRQAVASSVHGNSQQ